MIRGENERNPELSIPPQGFLPRTDASLYTETNSSVRTSLKNARGVNQETRGSLREVLGITPIAERSLKETWLARVPWERIGEKQIDPTLVPPIVLLRNVETLVAPHYGYLVLAGTPSRKNLSREDVEFMGQTQYWAEQEKRHGMFESGFLRESAKVFGMDMPPEHQQVETDLMNERSVFQRHAPAIVSPLASLRPLDFRLIVSLTGKLTESLTWTAYRALKEEADHPVIDFGLGHIMGDELTHERYYSDTAEKILSENPRKRVQARLFVQHFYKPVGIREVGEQQYDAAVIRLLENNRAMKKLTEKDAEFASLPGMKGLTPLTDAINASVERSRRNHYGASKK